MIEVREEIGLLKKYIGEQFDNRTFASTSQKTKSETPENVRQEQVYRLDDLNVTGEITEEYESDL